jgi:hypothetical protein
LTRLHSSAWNNGLIQILSSAIKPPEKAFVNDPVKVDLIENEGGNFGEITSAYDPCMMETNGSLT